METCVARAAVKFQHDEPKDETCASNLGRGTHGTTKHGYTRGWWTMTMHKKGKRIGKRMR